MLRRLTYLTMALFLSAVGAQMAVAQTTLIPTGSVWKYLADGSDQGVAWRPLGFSDVAWPSGPTEIGFGDGDEATNVGTNRLIITYYFRHVFTADPSSLSNLQVRL